MKKKNQMTNEVQEYHHQTLVKGTPNSRERDEFVFTSQDSDEDILSTGISSPNSRDRDEFVFTSQDSDEDTF